MRIDVRLPDVVGVNQPLRHITLLSEGSFNAARYCANGVDSSINRSATRARPGGISSVGRGPADRVCGHSMRAATPGSRRAAVAFRLVSFWLAAGAGAGVLRTSSGFGI